MKPFLLSFLTVSAAQAGILITEVNSRGSDHSGDFFELHNYGAEAVPLAGWKWTDDEASFHGSKAVTFGDVTIAPGETIVVLQGTGSYTEASFRAAWNGLAPGIQVVDVGGPGLGGNDAVVVFDAAGNLAAAFNYKTVELTATNGDGATVSVPPFVKTDGSASSGGHAGAAAGGAEMVSAVWVPTSGTSAPRYAFASPGVLDAYARADYPAAVGSPGRLGSGGIGNLPPVFSNPPEAYGVEGFNLNNSGFFVQASDPNPGQTVTLSVVSKPDWLTVNPATGGLAGMPPAAGTYLVTVRATDNGSPAVSAEQTITLTIFAESAPVLLNEYSAVGATDFLGGGTASDPSPADPFFGRVEGNGGEWFELVVVGTGEAGSTVDLRGWRIDVLGDLGTRTIVLSDDPYWSDVAAGTLLTFTTSNTVQGGLDTQIHKTSALRTSGVLWSSVWIFDPAFVSQSASTFNNRLGISNANTRFVIRNAEDAIVFGPAGEGIATGGAPPDLVGVNSTEVVKLETNPVPYVDPYYSPYNDGTTSTFGAPNVWSGGANAQSFHAYRRPNSPPQFTSQPLTRARGGYQYVVTASDPDGHAVTLSATQLPDFLTLTPGGGGTATLSLNRPLTLADAGFHTVRLEASDGQPAHGVTPQAFTLTVAHDAPSVILNEYNAVAEGNFIGGPDADAVDTHFGRVAGNGGRWFELVVTGDGGPGAVDLRGWSVEIGSSRQDQPFEATNVLTFSQAASWSAVRAGTILTFSDANSAGGGLDSGWNLRDRSATLGDSWSHVWMGDAALVAVSGGTVNGNVVEGIGIDNDDTQFVIKNAAGQIVFGPAGEGVAPRSGISSTEIFELEGHPAPDVSPFITSDDTVSPPREGYDDGASGSTFGWPNEWHLGTGGEIALQDFTRYAETVVEPTPYQTWINGFPGLADLSPDGDDDLDGRSNYEEYAFGGDPGASDGAWPQSIARGGEGSVWKFAIRDDGGLRYTLLRSVDLLEWSEAAGAVMQAAPHPVLAGFLEAEVTLPPAAVNGKEFFRIELEIPTQE